MDNLFKLNSNNNFAEIEANYEKVLLEPYHYINATSGKGFRDTVIQVFNHWLKIDQADAEFVESLIQWLHTSSLLIDDIQDSSELRRGNSASHVIYGNGRTVTAVDIFFMDILLSINCGRHADKLRLISLNCLEFAQQGQIMEIYWRDNFTCPSEEDYLNMAVKKCGHLIYTLDAYMELYSKTAVNLKKLSMLIGIYFQIVDDYRGLNSQLYYKSKGFCDDIREGKFILPVVHAINSRPNDKRILENYNETDFVEILKMHTDDVHLKTECLELLKEYGSMEYTRNKIINLKNLIEEELKQFEFNDSFKKIFEIQHFDE